MAPTFCSKTAKNGSLQNKVTEIQLPHINICKMQKENEMKWKSSAYFCIAERTNLEHIILT